MTAHVGDVLDLAVVRDAPAASIVQIHEFVDRSLSRSRSNWEEFEIPAERALADDVWELVSGLADHDADEEKVIEPLEAARLAYIELYEDAEAIAQSSITAAARCPPSAAPRFRRSGRFLRATSARSRTAGAVTVSRALSRF